MRIGGKIAPVVTVDPILQRGTMSPAPTARSSNSLRSSNPAHSHDRRPATARRRPVLLAAALVIGLGATGLIGPSEAMARTTDGKAAIQIPMTGEGVAAVYSDKLHGRKTASGVKYDKNKLTAAHKTLPFGTRVRLTNEKTGKSALVTINDRGPHQPDRDFDLSRASALALGMKPISMARLRYEIEP